MNSPTISQTLPPVEDIAQAIDFPIKRWKNNCHAVSLAVVRSGILAPPGPDTCRVVRGFTAGYGIGSQHSWIVLGRPFSPNTVMVDVTAHRWGKVAGVVVRSVADAYLGANMGVQGHVAHGYLPGTIWNHGRPANVDEADAFVLDTSGMSGAARDFVTMLGPLSAQGWMDLVTFPHQGWPAVEICTAIVQQVPRAEVLLPIDVVGHATDLNPSGLYW